MKYSDKRKEKAINTFKLAMGTAQYCKSCRALMTYGVNSKEAMVAIGVPSQAWVGWLNGHEAYHKAKGEALPLEWTAMGISQAFKDTVLAPKPKYVARKAYVPTAEDKALKYFKHLAGPDKAANMRDDSKPVLVHLDTRAFASFK